MRRTWVSSVVAGLLVLAPIAAVAQSAGQEADEGDEVAAVLQEKEETGGELEDSEEVDTLELVDETVTDDVDEGDDPAGESNDHGERVSTVARCAPTGSFADHGAFVRAVAQGETVTVDGTTHDLSTAEGVAALCDWATADEPSDGGSVETTSDHDESGDRPEDAGRPDHAGPPADAGPPAHAGTASNGKGGGNGKANGRGR